MFQVTLRHLDATAAHANQTFEEICLERVRADKLLVLLTNFAGIDAHQNNEAEPEISIDAAAGRFLVRSDSRRLLLQNTRRYDEPAIALSPEEVIGEVDGTAPAARRAAAIAYVETLAPFPVPAEEPAYVPPPKPKEKPSWAMFAVSIVMGAALIFQLSSAREAAAGKEPAWLDDDAATTQREDLAGVYLTGTGPGQHGIALTADGSIKIFEFNAALAPSVVNDNYRPGYFGEKLVLGTTQPGGPITVSNPTTLFYGGETFRRLP